MPYSLVRTLMADSLPRAFVETELEAQGFRIRQEHPGLLTAVASQGHNQTLLHLFEPADNLLCATAAVAHLPPRNLPGETVFLDHFRAQPPRMLAPVRRESPPLREFHEDRLAFLVQPSAEGLEVSCFRQDTGQELASVRRPWPDLEGRADELLAVGILTPHRTLPWPKPSLLGLLFGRDFQQPYYDEKFGHPPVRHFVAGADGVLTGLAYARGLQYTLLLFGEGGRMLAAQDIPRLPDDDVITGHDLLLRGFRSPRTFKEVVARCESEVPRGAAFRQLDEAGFHFIVALGADGLLHATVFGPEGQPLLHTDRCIREFNGAAWQSLQERDAVPRGPHPLRRDHAALPAIEPVPWPRPSLLRLLFGLPYREDYYLEKLGHNPLARHGGALTVLIFDSPTGLQGFAFAEDGHFVLHSVLDELPPRMWTAFQVVTGMFGMTRGLRWENFRADFQNSRFLKETDESGLRFLCAGRDGFVVGVFTPEGRGIQTTTRGADEWDEETRRHLRARGLIP